LLHQLLHRDDAARAREHRYRMAQAIVFGLPVVLLDLIGDKLGGRGDGLWPATFAAILSGWVLYVGAAGMGFEGIVRLYLHPREFTLDLPVAIIAVAAWIWASVSLGLGFAAAHAGHLVSRPAGPGFDICVCTLAIWTGARYRYYHHRIAIDPHDPEAA
jgi:hypothetical protein